MDRSYHMNHQPYSTNSSPSAGKPHYLEGGWELTFISTAGLVDTAIFHFTPVSMILSCNITLTSDDVTGKNPLPGEGCDSIQGCVLFLFIRVLSSH
uniref:Uncharacterized protein n=1 Tax=Timema cristinae TaxID=61476 RepID=A0A7R9D328_TIMCR|nr:unnamed protein product [Timema cristinae]